MPAKLSIEAPWLVQPIGAKLKKMSPVGALQCSAPAEIQTKVQYVVKVQACLLDHRLHQLLIRPTRWDRSVEAVAGLCSFVVPGHDLDNGELATQ